MVVCIMPNKRWWSGFILCSQKPGFRPLLCLRGKLRLGKNRSFFCCLESEVKLTDAPVVNAKFLDGAAVVQMLNPRMKTTCQDFWQIVCILSAWNSGLSGCSLGYTSQKLRVDGNKTELFKLLSEQLTNLPIAEWRGTCIYATDGSNVLCSLADADMRNLVPCSHEEADTSLFLHVADAVQKGCKLPYALWGTHK